jgi:transcriptional regulator with XRE-family HTH domain
MREYEICFRCKAARKARGVTLQELAAQCGINKDYLSAFERGKFNGDILQAYYVYVLYESETKTIQALLKGGI